MGKRQMAGEGRDPDSAGYAPDVRAGYRRTEVGVIPEDWESSSVGAIASSTPNAIAGGPFGSNLVSRDYVAHGVPVIRGQNMGGRWVSGDFVFVTPAKARALEANQARPGDIVFTQRGTLGQVSLVPERSFRAVEFLTWRAPAILRRTGSAVVPVQPFLPSSGLPHGFPRSVLRSE